MPPQQEVPPSQQFPGSNRCSIVLNFKLNILLVIHRITH
jgi:hypothetical protein